MTDDEVRAFLGAIMMEFGERPFSWSELHSLKRRLGMGDSQLLSRGFIRGMANNFAVHIVITQAGKDFFIINK